MEVYFILVNPAIPENVGSSARAMNTMGFKNLRLVNPCDYLNDNARTLAHGSYEILEQAEVFPSLGKALNDIEFSIGTTAKERSAKYDYHHCSKLPEILKRKGQSVNHAALVFGREESGLTNEEISMCDLVTTIPMVASYPSLNLSQAVMIYAYTLAGTSEYQSSKSAIRDETGSYKALKTKIGKILNNTGIRNNPTLFSRIMERIAYLGEDDIHLLHSITNEIILKFKNEDFRP